MYCRKIFVVFLLMSVALAAFAGCGRLGTSAPAIDPILPENFSEASSEDDAAENGAWTEAIPANGQVYVGADGQAYIGADGQSATGGKAYIGADGQNAAGGKAYVGADGKIYTTGGGSASELSGTTSPTENDTDVKNENIVSITISAAGDVTMGNYVGQDYAWSFREMYDKADSEGYFFENVYDIFSRDDMTIVNLECVLTDSEEMSPDRTYNIKGDPGYVNILTYGSVEAVSMANNHRQDFGQKGTKDTLEALDAVGIVHAYDTNVGMYEVKGIRIGFVSVNETSWGQGVEKLMKDGIAKLKEENADLILACCHWGIEREYYPTDYQQQFGRLCIDWGADVVIGHHPHVIQGVEEYQGKYIVYSLGNFCFGGNRNPADKDTLIAQQTFTFVDGQRQEETEFRLLPCSISSDPSRNDYRPTPAEGEKASRILGRVNEYSAGFGLQFDEEGHVCK